MMKNAHTRIAVETLHEVEHTVTRMPCYRRENRAMPLYFCDIVKQVICFKLQFRAIFCQKKLTMKLQLRLKCSLDGP